VTKKIARLIELCHKFTDLATDDINELARTAADLAKKTSYDDSDVFIDVINATTKEALVVFHQRPKDRLSLYKKDIIGQDALMKNEPGVMRTFETSLNTIGLLAVSQEERPIVQNIYPIRNNRKTIGVIIVEFGMMQDKQPEAKTDPTQLDTTEEIPNGYKNHLSEAIMEFNTEGNLVSYNKGCLDLYRKLGYKNQLLGMHYDNLTLDYTTFEYSLYQFSCMEHLKPLESSAAYLDYYFKMKRIWLYKEKRMVLIIQDITEVHKKNEEIISKSVAIQEIHHRVKNNLQSVVSLLRVQSRQTKSQEARKVLNESVNRIMAIAATHELLSKQTEDHISLYQTIDVVVYNFRRVFQNASDIQITIDIDPLIMVDSNQMVSISIIINELLQNIFEHAYLPEQKGQAKISSALDRNLLTITVEDDGNGYNTRSKKNESLGLMIVQSYVKDKLKGKLKIESNQHGTKTMFYFDKNNKEVVR